MTTQLKDSFKVPSSQVLTAMLAPARATMVMLAPRSQVLTAMLVPARERVVVLAEMTNQYQEFAGQVHECSLGTQKPGGQIEGEFPNKHVPT